MRTVRQMTYYRGRARRWSKRPYKGLCSVYASEIRRTGNTDDPFLRTQQEYNGTQF